MKTRMDIFISRLNDEHADILVSIKDVETFTIFLLRKTGTGISWLGSGPYRLYGELFRVAMSLYVFVF